MSPEALGAELSRIALETHRSEYAELSEIWRNLDTKAQGLGALAGIFLAAALAWARELPTDATAPVRAVVIGTIVLLVLTIVAAVFALQVRAVTASPLGPETEEMLQDILGKAKDGEQEQRLVAFNNDQIAAWKDTNDAVRGFNESKAQWVSFGQVTLLIAALIVATFSSLTVLLK